MFGGQSIDPARKALDLFKNEGVTKILELSVGQGGIPFFSLKLWLDPRTPKRIDAIAALRFRKSDPVRFLPPTEIHSSPIFSPRCCQQDG
jgi:hypothetical protein